MRMRAMPKPSVLVAGALEDNGRFLFVKRKSRETEALELPHIVMNQGSDPSSALSELFLSQLGIDAQVHEPIYETRHNSGSRKNKRFIPVLVFRITAKKAFAKPSGELGYAWFALEDARKKKLSRNAEWVR